MNNSTSFFAAYLKHEHWLTE